MAWIVKTEAYSAWDSGARTVASFTGDGAFTFTVGQSTGIVCGLNSADGGAGYVEIDHAFFIENNKARVVERGVIQTSSISYSKSHVFKLERLRGVVQYFINDVLVYTSLLPSMGSVFGDCSLYSKYDEIFDATIINYQETSGGVVEVIAPTGTSSGVITLTGGSVVSEGVIEVTGTLETSEGVIELTGTLNTVTGVVEFTGVITSSGEVIELTGIINISEGTIELKGIVGFFRGDIDLTGTIDIAGVVTELTGTINSTSTLPALTAKGDEFSQVLSGTLPALIGRGSEFSNVLLSELPALTGGGVTHSGGRLSAVFPALTARGNTGVVNLLAAVLPSLGAHGEEAAGLLPEYNALDGELARLQAGGYELIDENNHVDSELPSLIALGVEVDQVFSYALLPAVQAGGYLGYTNYFGITFPGFILDFRQLVDAAAAAMTLPEMTLSATGFTDSCTATLTLPTPLLTTRLGAKVQLNLPPLELTTTTTSEGFATVQLTLPVPTLASTALSGEVARGSLILPALELTTRTGATAPLTLPTLTLASQATYVDVARIALTLPLLSLQSTGERHGQATVYLELPALTLTAGPSRAELTLPMLVLSSVATVEDTTEGTTWAINITSGAATQLLLGQFDQLVTAHGRLYGRQGTTLVCLDGEVDGVDTPIPITVRFAPQTFGTHQLKRMSDVYLSTREYEGLTLSVITDETTTWDYQTATDNAPAYGTHKVKVGRGTAFHTAGLILKNRGGGVLDVGGLELLVTPLSRKV